MAYNTLIYGVLWRFRKKMAIEFQSFNVRHFQLSLYQSTIFAISIIGSFFYHSIFSYSPKIVKGFMYQTLLL
jgi:hypothetical protein